MPLQEYQRQSLTQQSAPRRQTPSLVPNSPNEGLYQTLQRFIQSNREVLDQEAVRKAESAALTDYNRENFEKREENDLYSDIYNRVGFELYLNDSLVSIDNSLTELLTDPQYRADPERLNEAGSQLIVSATQQMPDDIRLPFQQNASRRLASLSQTANANRQTETLEQHAARFQEAEIVLLDQIQNAAYEGDLEWLSSLQEEYVGMLSRNGPVTQGGTGLVTAQDLATRTRLAYRQSQVSAFEGAFDRYGSMSDKFALITFVEEGGDFGTPLTQEEREQLAQWYSNSPESEEDMAAFAELKDKELRANMDEETRRIVANTLRNKLNIELSDQNRNNSMDSQVTTAMRDGAEREFYMNPTQATFQRAAEIVDPSKIRTMRDYLDGVRYDDDPAIINDLNMQFFNGELTVGTVRSFVGNGLSVDSANSMLDRLQEQETERPWMRSDAWGEMVRRLDVDFPVERDMFGIIDNTSEMAQIHGRVQSTMYDWALEAFERYENNPDAERPDILTEYRRQVNFEKEAMNRAADLTPDTVVPQRYLDDPALLNRDFDDGLVNERLYTLYAEEIERRAQNE